MNLACQQTECVMEIVALPKQFLIPVKFAPGKSKKRITLQILATVYPHSGSYSV